MTGVPWWSWCLLTFFLVLVVHAVTCVLCLSKDVRRRVMSHEASIIPSTKEVPMLADGSGATGASNASSSAMSNRPPTSNAPKGKATTDPNFFSSYFQLDDPQDAEGDEMTTFHTRIPSEVLLPTTASHVKSA